MKARIRKSLLQAALDYAAKGWPVFPVGRNKVPLIKDWPNKASTNPTRISHWWRRWPKANIAVLTGKASGLVVIDVDTKALPEELKELEASTTAIAKTAKGRHYYFQAPDEPLKTRQLDFADIKAEGSNVTAPPSQHKSGKRYRWIRETKPKPMPDWLLRLTTKKKPKLKLKQGEAIPEGKRHKTLASMAGRYRNLGLGYRELLALLKEANKSCKPPHDLEDIERIARDMAEKPLAEDEVVILDADEMEPKILKWLWLDRIPLCCPTIFFGLAGKGKSTKATNIAAIVSIGGSWPNSKAMKAPKGTVLYVGQEDPYEEVVIPRFIAMGGNRKKLKFFGGIKRAKSPDSEYLDWIDISRDLPILEKRIKQYKDLRLIIFDPLTGTLGSKTDMFKGADIRRVVGPLAKLADKYGIALILVMHSNKNTQQEALLQIAGTAEFGNLARQVWMFGTDSKDPTRFLMVAVKKSYGLPATGLAFRVEQTNPTNISGVKLVYEVAPVQDSAHELWGQKKRGRHPDMAERLTQFYEKVLADGPAPIKQVDEVRENKFAVSYSTDFRVRREPKIIKVRPKTGKYAGEKCYKSVKLQKRKIRDF